MAWIDNWKTPDHLKKKEENTDEFKQAEIEIPEKPELWIHKQDTRIFEINTIYLT